MGKLYLKEAQNKGYYIISKVKATRNSCRPYGNYLCVQVLLYSHCGTKFCSHHYSRTIYSEKTWHTIKKCNTKVHDH